MTSRQRSTSTTAATTTTTSTITNTINVTRRMVRTAASLLAMASARSHYNCSVMGLRSSNLGYSLHTQRIAMGISISSHSTLLQHHQHNPRPQQQQQQQQQQPKQRLWSTRHFHSKDTDTTDHRSRRRRRPRAHNNKPKTNQRSPRQQILDTFEASHAATTSTSSSTTNNNTNTAEVQAQRQALIDTLDWLQDVVIGYNLCPFAEAPLLKDELAIQVLLSSTDERQILATLLAEAKRLQTNPGTSLVVCPNLSPNNFLGFLETYNVMVEGVLPDHELDDDIQIAPFHPLFVFGDDDSATTTSTTSNSDDEIDGDDIDDDEIDDEIGNKNNNNNNDKIDNYTNRSPHPTFHILREAEVATAVEALEGNAEKVWKRNVDLLEALEDLFVQDDNGNNDQSDLLRSVFLKGKANARKTTTTTINSTTSSSTTSTTTSKAEKSGCPVTKQIETYQPQIQKLLREFRKKEY